MTNINKEILSWITTVPAGDINFKTHLEEANTATMIKALQTIGLSKMARQKIEVRIRKLFKAQGEKQRLFPKASIERHYKKDRTVRDVVDSIHNPSPVQSSGIRSPLNSVKPGISKGQENARGPKKSAVNTLSGEKTSGPSSGQLSPNKNG